jgi:hypothetical protein
MSKTIEYHRIPLRFMPKSIILEKNNKRNKKRCRIITITKYNNRDLSLKFIIITSKISGNNIYF